MFVFQNLTCQVGYTNGICYEWLIYNVSLHKYNTLLNQRIHAHTINKNE